LIVAAGQGYDTFEDRHGPIDFWLPGSPGRRPSPLDALLSGTMSGSLQWPGARQADGLEAKVPPVRSLAGAAGQEQAVGLGEHLSEDRSAAKLGREVHAVVPTAG
jgi:hypothetical protein